VAGEFDKLLAGGAVPDADRAAAAGGGNAGAIWGDSECVDRGGVTGEVAHPFPGGAVPDVGAVASGDDLPAVGGDDDGIDGADLLHLVIELAPGRRREWFGRLFPMI
jgi:hypothetical protein